MKVYIVKTMRTPIGKTGGCFKYLPVEILGAKLMAGLLNQSKVPTHAVEKIILANSVGQGGNIARLSAFHAFGRKAPPAVTVDYQCGGSLMALEMGSAYIRSGMHDVLLVGGAESTSLEPQKYLHEKDPKHSFYPAPLVRAPFTPLDLKDQGMLEGAENTAVLLQSARQALDEIALVSHQRASDETTIKTLEPFVIPIAVNGRLVTQDESIRPNMRMRLLERMPSLVHKEGITTAGNACLTHDGAAGMLLASEQAVEKYNLKPQAELLMTQCTSVNPSYSPLGALSATKKVMQKLSLQAHEVDLFEVNEAFAVKTQSIINHLKVEHNKVNKLGGTLAYGHPYSATGAILITHLTAALACGQTGIASMGVAGGLGIAVAIKKL